MSKQEKKIINNIANKLEIVLHQNQITTLGLSKLLDVDKQPLYRILKREHIPNILFLEMIANYLKCTILELMADEFFLDIQVYNNYDVITHDAYANYRIYVVDENFMQVVGYKFFGILAGSHIKVFYEIDTIITDGYYLYQNGSTLEEINIISAGKNLLIALINNEEVRLEPSNITVQAKLYTTVAITQLNGYAVAQ